MSDGLARCVRAARARPGRHDRDAGWGVPAHDGRTPRHCPMPEGFPAGRSRSVTRRGRGAFRAGIAATVAGACIRNALQDCGEDFARFRWHFTDGAPIRGAGVARAMTLSRSVREAPDRRGLSPVRPGDVPAWMQAAGAVDARAPGCVPQGRG